MYRHDYNRLHRTQYHFEEKNSKEYRRQTEESERRPQ
jgi:hypothetical protein